MITNLYYYGYYLPNRINTASGGLRRVTRVSKIQSETKSELYGSYSRKSEETTFSLNKSLNAKILRYADSLSKNVNGLKNTANAFLVGTNEETLESGALDYEKLEKNVSDSLQDFSKVFNDFKRFAKKNNAHSRKMSDFSDELNTIVDQNKKGLNQAGLTITEDEFLNFDENRFQKQSVSSLYASVSNLRDMFQKVYDATYDMMNYPLSEHMNFKDLNYYYNYNYSSVDVNTFKIIETGMIVDIAV